MSHPVWVCGLKHKKSEATDQSLQVTPCMGVWIETTKVALRTLPLVVTPCMGVWIETRVRR